MKQRSQVKQRGQLKQRRRQRVPRRVGDGAMRYEVGAGLPEPYATPASGERSASVSSVAAQLPVVNPDRIFPSRRPVILPSPLTRLASPVLCLTAGLGGHHR